MEDLTGNQVKINGISGTVTVDHQDGTYSVHLANNTVYFATLEEITPQVATVEKPTTKKAKATKFHQIYEAVKNCQEVTVKTKNGTRPCVVIGSYERNYFNVQAVDGQVFNVHLNRINPSGGMCHLNRGGYVTQVLKAMECYL